MPKIGEFQQTENGFKGGITTPDKYSPYEFAKNDDKENDQQPDYIVKAPNGAEVGAAWDRTARESNKPYVSYDIDDPSRSQLLRGNLSKNEKSGNWDAYFSRDIGQTQGQSYTASDSMGAEMPPDMQAPPMGNDEFPAPEHSNGKGKNL